MTDSITNKYGTKIRVGQIWADMDSRHAGRTWKVVTIEGSLAICLMLTVIGGAKPTRYRGTHIQIDRLHPTKTGYRLIGDPEAES